MPIQRYRSVADMPPPWREPDDPDTLNVVAKLMDFYRSVRGSRATPAPRVQRFRSIEEMNAARRHPDDMDRVRESVKRRRGDGAGQDG